MAVDRLTIDERRFAAASGVIHVQHLSSVSYGGADLGNYSLAFADSAVQSDGSVLANVRDDGGPLELRGSISINLTQSLATLSGSIKERSEVPPGVKQALDQWVQLRGRDREGRIPVDFEIAL